MADNPLPATPTEWLSAEIRAVEAFLALLDDEARALTRAWAPDALQAAVAAKQALARELGALHAQHEQHAAQSGASAPAHGAEDPVLHAQRRQLAELAARARAANERNGQLIAEGLRTNAAALRAIEGATGNAVKLYTARGQVRGGQPGRTLATG